MYYQWNNVIWWIRCYLIFEVFFCKLINKIECIDLQDPIPSSSSSSSPRAELQGAEPAQAAPSPPSAVSPSVAALSPVFQSPGVVSKPLVPAPPANAASQPSYQSQVSSN